MTRHTAPPHAMLAALLLLATTLPATAAPSTSRPAYGCLKVNAPITPIRDRASDKAAVVASASRGDVLIKLKRFCSLTGRWCSVSANGTTGWVEKAATKIAPCPPSTSKPKS